jgi:hypothetical protein
LFFRARGYTVKFKNYCLLILGCTCIITNSHASFISSLPFRLYTGLSGGVDRMTGNRSEQVYNSGIPETFSFTNNTPMKDTNAQYSLFAGATWPIPKTAIFIGPEVYIGKGHADQEMRQYVFNPNTNFNRVLVSSISQGLFYGLAIKGGFTFAKSYSAYVIFGVESCRLRNRVTYVPESNGGGIPDDPTAFFQATNYRSGYVGGFGLEKAIGCVRIGADIRFIQYGRFRPSFGYPIKEDTIQNAFHIKNKRYSLTLSYHF